VDPHVDPRVDPTILQRLALLPGSEGRDLATELVDSFSGRMPESLAELHELSARGDRTALARAAHSLRGAALQLGAGPFAALALQLESTAQTGNEVDIRRAVTALDADWPDTAAALRAACAPTVTPAAPPPAT
jgi:HPt (histidine-containing phosphotransfer) domain-containing protein